MNCERCQGLLLADRYNVLAGVDLRACVMWRCVNCGNILDSQIVKHRTLQKYHVPIATSLHEPVGMFSEAVVDNG
ncbi:MAG: hypothetical protein M3Z35_06110 [Nitrospirota bacterium]|nr:hypothetical protein [Nitrospirota bacterium]